MAGITSNILNISNINNVPIYLVTHISICDRPLESVLKEVAISGFRVLLGLGNDSG